MISPRTPAFCCGSSSGFSSTRRSSGTSPIAAAKSPSCSWTTSSLPASRAAWKSDRAYMRCETATRLLSASSAEKSSSPIASSISLRWSSRSSTLPVTLAVAASVSSATSERICSSARTVSASICLRVSSSRRCRSASASSRARSRCESATLRASARIVPASLFAWPISCLCSSSSLRASARACSASSTAERMRSRRSSIIFWIGPNANFLSTKKVIAKQTSVQIIRPGTTSISGDAARIIG